MHIEGHFLKLVVLSFVCFKLCELEIMELDLPSLTKLS